MEQEKRRIDEMDALSLNKLENHKIKYLTFSNKDGKQWSIPIKNMRVALELYEPSGLKGKMLKKILPLIAKIGVGKFILHGSNSSIKISRNLKELLVMCFGEQWEFSVFWGTPCVDQKITIQIYNGKEILGYCKIGNSEQIEKLFKHEKNILDLLEQKGIRNVPRALVVEKVSDEYWAFVQSTEKVQGARTEHNYNEKQRCFIEKLWRETRKTLPFEETDYYQSLVLLEEHLYLIDKEYREIVKETLYHIKKLYKDRLVEWGMCHRDFTPWNTCVIEDELFVFDFEYALKHAPKEIDKWHFFVQTKCFECKYSMEQIAKIYSALDDKNNVLMKCYLLDIISLYLLRNSEMDRKIANERAELLYLIMK